MRILTYIRQVLDAEESVRVTNNAVALENSKLVMDTMDEYGVEEALRLRESGFRLSNIDRRRCRRRCVSERTDEHQQSEPRRRPPPVLPGRCDVRQG